MKALVLSFSAFLVETLLPIKASQFEVEPFSFGFSVVRKDDEFGRHEAVQIALSSITEMGADGTPVGIGRSPSHRVTAFDYIFTSFATNGSQIDRDDLPFQQLSLAAAILGGSTAVNLTASTYLGGGDISTFEPSTVIEAGNGTVRIDVQVSNWSFCTPFGQDGGQECWVEAQDILLEDEAALPAAPIPPPPHTLLIPRCDEEIVATFRFVCDPRLTVCTDLTSVKFYLGEADQPPGQAPNTATISGSNTNGSTAEAFAGLGESGIYEHNLTRSEVSGFLHVSSLTPGLDYIFWSVWEHGSASTLESNSQTFDLSRKQYWQCPGTTIERNFEVGTSLSMSFVIDSPSQLEAACDEFSSILGQHGDGVGASISSDSVTAVASTATRGLTERLLSRDRLHFDEENQRYFNETYCTYGGDGGGVGWRWGEGGAIFRLGEYSTFRLASQALLDGLWTPLTKGFSTANEEGEITASVGKFGFQAVYSTLVLFNDVEPSKDTSIGKIMRKTATWVAIAFCLLLMWLVGCCAVRLPRITHAARTWPAAIIRGRVFFKTEYSSDGANSVGSTPSDPENPEGVKELQLFPMAGSVERQLLASLSPSYPPQAAPITGLVTPGTVHPKPKTRIGSSPREAFSLSLMDAPELLATEKKFPRIAKPEGVELGGF